MKISLPLFVQDITVFGNVGIFHAIFMYRFSL